MFFLSSWLIMFILTLLVDSCMEADDLMLTVGKKYICRNGEIVGPFINGGYGLYPFCFGASMWMVDGVYNSKDECHERDIMEEI